MIETILDEGWVHALSHYDTIYVGFSGGLDSTALLHCLGSIPSLASKVHAIHIHHGLSPHADAWERHTRTFCQQWNINCSTYSVTIPTNNNIEDQARKARYLYFSALLSHSDALLLGHHRDDQAETLLLNLLRGAGVDGLAAMKSKQKLGSGDLIRPLLTISRDQIMRYALHHELEWIEDESNQNERFSRNFLRHQVIPLLQKKWPAAIENITRAAIHCQSAKTNLDDLAILDCPELLHKSQLSITHLLSLNHDRCMNVLRVWLKQNGFILPTTHIFNRIINEVIRARPDASPLVEFGNICIRRFRNELYYVPLNTLIKSEGRVRWENFPQPLIFSSYILGVESASFGICIETSDQVEVYFRKGGETIQWHGQTKSLKKLMQEWSIPPWLRNQIPLVYVNNALAIVVGYAISDLFYEEATPKRKTVYIRKTPYRTKNH